MHCKNKNIYINIDLNGIIKYKQGAAGFYLPAAVMSNFFGLFLTQLRPADI